MGLWSNELNSVSNRILNPAGVGVTCSIIIILANCSVLESFCSSVKWLRTMEDKISVQQRNLKHSNPWGISLHPLLPWILYKVNLSLRSCNVNLEVHLLKRLRKMPKIQVYNLQFIFFLLFKMKKEIKIIIIQATTTLS